MDTVDIGYVIGAAAAVALLLAAAVVPVRDPLPRAFARTMLFGAMVAGLLAVSFVVAGQAVPAMGTAVLACTFGTIVVRSLRAEGRHA